jgi:phytoene dehydrogenase-like protein
MPGRSRATLDGRWDERETHAFATRVEAEVERRVPGFRELIRMRHVFAPPKLAAALGGGSVNQGRSASG